MTLSEKLARATRAQERRDALLAANRCINGPISDTPSKRIRIVHGPVVGKRRCQRCLDVRRLP